MCASEGIGWNHQETVSVLVLKIFSMVVAAWNWKGFHVFCCKQNPFCLSKVRSIYELHNILIEAIFCINIIFLLYICCTTLTVRTNNVYEIYKHYLISALDTHQHLCPGLLDKLPSRSVRHLYPTKSILCSPCPL